jgi:tetratricopeptide (TPR) repeat protein
VNANLLGDGRRTLLVAALSLAGIAMTVTAERSSEARANRLHRGDELAEAAAIYDQRIVDDPSAPDLRYNRGTTLLRLGEPGALEELAAGTGSDDARLEVRVRYNMGLSSLIAAFLSPSNDSTIFHAASAIEANKRALRLDPNHMNARWNLALAQIILADAAPEPGVMDPGDITGPEILGDRMESSNAPDLANREGIDETFATGEEEALAGDDLAPLSVLEASEILGTSHLDPSTILTKLLLREGRNQRRRGIYVQGNPW